MDFLFRKNNIKNTKTMEDNNEKAKEISVYKKKYLNTFVGKNKIINVGEMYFNKQKIIFYDVMCHKCSRVQRLNDLDSMCTCTCYSQNNNNSSIKYRKNDIRKTLFERREEKKLIDDLWDARIIPSKIFINDSMNGKCFIKDFCSGNSVFPTYLSYFLNDNNLTGMGLYKIKELNSNYFISNYIYYTNEDGYIEYNNIYDNFEYEYKPIIYYICNNEKVNPNYKILNNFEMNELEYIFFEKDKEYFNLYKYNNTKLIKKIQGISKVIKKKSYGYLLELKGGIIKFYSIIDDRIYETKDNNNTFEKILGFGDFNTNVYVNVNEINNYAENKLQNYLENSIKVDNIMYKKIYIMKDEKISNKILFKYLADNFKLEKVNNEFDDDKMEMYSVIIDRNNKKAISFLEYLSEIKKADSFRFKIYGIDISTIISTLFSNYEFKNKICDLIKKDIIKVENKELKNNYIHFIYNYYFDIDNVNVQLCKKLMEKYNVDELGLFLIVLYKYGEENVLNIPNIENKILTKEEYSTSVRYTCENIENQNLYNEIICNIDLKEIKWKSEFLLYKLIKTYFSDAIFQYRDVFLGRQSLDVYVPSLRIAFEYQGLQHFEVIEYFGGEENFKIRQKNDEKKKELCKKNNIYLIEWKYDESINKIILDKKLSSLKNIIGNTYSFSGIE